MGRNGVSLPDRLIVAAAVGGRAHGLDGEINAVIPLLSSVSALGSEVAPVASKKTALAAPDEIENPVAEGGIVTSVSMEPVESAVIVPSTSAKPSSAEADPGEARVIVTRAPGS
jgi:hypothetical protein